MGNMQYVTGFYDSDYNPKQNKLVYNVLHLLNNFKNNIYTLCN